MNTAPSSRLDDAFSLDWLLAQDFPPIKYIVPGIIPEGVTVIAGAPKAGKSWMVLDLALCVAGGDPTLCELQAGEKRPVMYVALEDGPRRLKMRTNILGVNDGYRYKRLTLKTAIEPGQAISTIREYIDRHHGDNPVVIVDTLAKVMPTPVSGVSAYAADYAAMTQFKLIVADYPGSSIILVHHTRKMGAEDFSDTVSGTQGITGAADTTVVLKRARGEATGTLFVTSRDAAEGEYSVTLDGHRWRLDGGTLAEAAKAAVERKATDGLGDQMAEVIRFVNGREKTTAGDLAAALGLEANAARTYLSRAVESGRISKSGRGVYVPNTPVASVATVASEEDVASPRTEQGDDNATHATVATPPSEVLEVIESIVSKLPPLPSPEPDQGGLF
ncbi:AAA family ATPase [Sinomonas sp. P47F7]|uniref:AAA family ATPase n=1 Tax=Sinomonas sp. P47F7 TaxID=3410987 RepID=UPI003BF5FE67